MGFPPWRYEVGAAYPARQWRSAMVLERPVLHFRSRQLQHPLDVNPEPCRLYHPSDRGDHAGMLLFSMKCRVCNHRTSACARWLSTLAFVAELPR